MQFRAKSYRPERQQNNARNQSRPIIDIYDKSPACKGKCNPDSDIDIFPCIMNFRRYKKTYYRGNKSRNFN